MAQKFTKNISHMIHPFPCHIAMCDYSIAINTTNRQAWCLLQVKLFDPCLSALKWFVYTMQGAIQVLCFTFNILKGNNFLL